MALGVRRLEYPAEKDQPWYQSPLGEWCGGLDELIWSRPLSAAEIRGIYAAGLAQQPVFAAAPQCRWYETRAAMIAPSFALLIAVGIDVNMPQFNAALGTITGLKIQLSFNYSAKNTGGPGGGVWGVTDQFKANSTLLNQGGVTFTQIHNMGTSVPGDSTGFDGTAITVDGPYSAFIGNSTFLLSAFSPNTSFNGGGASAVAFSLSLVAPSSITATYTYAPAVAPEPLSIAGVAAISMVTVRRRRAR